MGDGPIPPFAVLNPGGRDAERSFEEGPGSPEDAGHPPVNYHGYAAARRGGFYRDVSRVPEGAWVLLLVRRKVGLVEGALKRLRERGCKVAISFKEAGVTQVAAMLDDPGRIGAVRRLAAEVDAVLAPTPEMADFFWALGAGKVAFIPNPYPVGEKGWDFRLAEEGRMGVFVGTREFEVPARAHFMALAVAGVLGVRVTVVNTGGGRGRRRLEAMGLRNLEIVDGPLGYAAYLRVMARHQLVLQMDRSGVPGQVAGDALLCGIPCVGGDGAVDRVAHPDTCGYGRGVKELAEIARQILAGNAPVMHPERVQYSTVASQIGELFA